MKGLSPVAATVNDDVNNPSASPQLFILDQKFLCFDIELGSDAKQKLLIGRGEGKKQVAWRMRTNAPTRYIVYPNAGVLNDTCASQTITIELVGSRYNPQHILMVQAVPLFDNEAPKAIWKSSRAKSHENLQTESLELLTTVMSLGITLQTCHNRKVDESARLLSSLDQSSTTGQDRIQELEMLYKSVKSDTQNIKTNAEKAMKIKEALEAHLENRNQRIKDLAAKNEEAEKRINQLNAKIKSQEASLSQCRNRNKNAAENEECSVM